MDGTLGAPPDRITVGNVSAAPRIAVVGLGKLGLPLAAVLADAGFDVVGTDTYGTLRDDVRHGVVSTPEPGVADLLTANRLEVVDTAAEAAEVTDVAFVVVPTPSGDGHRFYAGHVAEACADLAEGFARRDRPGRPTIVVVSTVMPGTCGDAIADAIADAAPDTPIGLAYHPEFIALGSVVHDLRNPSTVYLGADDDAAADALWSVLRCVVKPGVPVHRLSLIDAETAKLAVNVYLSVKIGYANEVAATARRLGADPTAVLDAVGADRRIGSAYLRHGAPPSGPCLPRDVRAWASHGSSRFADAAAGTSADVVAATVAACEGAVTVGVLGYAYKPGSSIPDESYGWTVAEALVARNYAVCVHDPYVRGTPAGCGRGRIADVLSCDVVVIGCDHDEYAVIGHPRLVRP